MSEKTPRRRRTILILLPCIFIVGVGLSLAGIGLLRTDTTHVEDYSQCHGTNVDRACVATEVTRDSETYSECLCSWPFQVKKDIIGKVTLYYETEFDQTAYASSRDDSQLSGRPGDAPAHSCGDFSYNDAGQPIFPCGQLADSMFNDTFSSLKAEHEPKPYVVSYTTGETTTFRNPPNDVWDKFGKPKSWLFKKNNVWDSGSNITGVENEAFQAWMNTSLKRKPVFHLDDPALPEGLPAGNYSILIHIYCFSEKYGAKKFVLVGVSARARMFHVITGTVALVTGVGLSVGAMVLGVILLVIAIKRGYVANLGVVLSRVFASIWTRGRHEVIGSAALLLLNIVTSGAYDLYLSIVKTLPFLRKVKSVLRCPLIAGIVLVLVSIGFYSTIYTTAEKTHVEDYSVCHGTDVELACVARSTRNYTDCVCPRDFQVKEDIIGKVTLYYETDFDQTDSSYASSRDDSQLRGEPGAAPAQSCGNFSYDGGLPIFPCGELADSMFNDTFSSLKLAGESEPIAVSYTGLMADDAAYHNPSENVWDKFAKPKSWMSKKYNVWDSGSNKTGVENEAFRAWMDTSLKRKPVFLVVDRAMTNGLPAGNYSITIHIHCFSEKYGAKKFVLVGVSTHARMTHVVAGTVALVAGIITILYDIALLIKKHNMFSSLNSGENFVPYASVSYTGSSIGEDTAYQMLDNVLF